MGIRPNREVTQGWYYRRMMRRFLITKQPLDITATEIRVADLAVVAVLRFASLEELRKHFGDLGASSGALQAASNSFNAIGTAMLVLY